MGTSERIRLCQARVTLDGAPAKISGARLDYPGVARLDGRGGAVEWSWEAAARIVAAGGAFKSR